MIAIGSSVHVAALEAPDVASYTILFAGVAASWIGIPIVGAVALAAAGGLAADGQLDVWLVILVATLGAWTGGYIGYLLGARAHVALAMRPGRWQRQRQRALSSGERFYRRWGPAGVFLTPTWVSGALRMPRKRFLAWNAAAALVSSLVSIFGAYAIVSAVLGHLPASPALALLAVVPIAAAIVGAAVRRHRRRLKHRQTEATVRD